MRRERAARPPAERPQLKRDPLDGGTAPGVVSLIRNALVAILAGAATGAVLLGAGGRLAMSIFALATGRPSIFTFGGSMSVVFSGAIAGAVGGLVLALTHRLFRGGLWLRGLAFGVLCYLLAVPGLRPPQPLVFGLFAPFFLTYGVATVWARERLVTRGVNSSEDR